MTRVPRLDGETASAPIAPKFHTRNVNPRLPGWGGCFPSSVKTNAQYAGVPQADVDRFWAAAQREIGKNGSTINDMVNMIRRTMPKEKYFASTEADPRILDTLSRKGVAVASTMGWGERYVDQFGRPIRISHAISLAHYREGARACVVDSNFPGEFFWMPAAEYAARWLANGHLALALTRLPAGVVIAIKVGVVAGAVLLAVASLSLFGVSLVAIVATLIPRPPEPTPDALPAFSFA
ncbi:MAG: hypothetical protein P4L84_11015 [Isosphaeraceae bacterium]|nr:hypothetical protein [Isosphaeraceae bacterium]